MGAVIALTADHGMNAKTKADGEPNVIYLQDLLDGWLGREQARVILPITDPYVVHHGALGSFATVYLPADAIADVAARLRGLLGIEVVLTRDEAAARFELPADRIGDLVVVSERSVVLGTGRRATICRGSNCRCVRTAASPSSGCRSCCNRPIEGIDPNRRWRNFDVFDLALNHAQ